MKIPTRTHEVIEQVLKSNPIKITLSTQEITFFGPEKKEVFVSDYFQEALKRALFYHRVEAIKQHEWEFFRDIAISMFRRLWGQCPILRDYFNSLFIELNFSEDFTKRITENED